MLPKFLHTFLTGTSSKYRAGRQARRRSLARRLRLECLEDRLHLNGSPVMVTTGADSGPGSLRAVLASAVSGETIEFAPSVHTIKLTSAELTISQSVHIQGPGANQLTISGNNAYRVFEAAAGLNVAISGLTITDGYALYQGGGILNDGSNLTLSGDDLTQNVVAEIPTDAAPVATELAANGGGVYSAAGNLVINNCQVIANQAVGAPAATSLGDAWGGGLFVSGGTAAITGSLFANNLVQGGNNSQDGDAWAGGIQSFASITIGNSAFSGNRSVGGNNTLSYASGGGGACLRRRPHGLRPVDDLQLHLQFQRSFSRKRRHRRLCR